MRFMFTNNAPVSAHAATGACAVTPDARLRAASPAAVRLLAARQLPMTNHDWAQNLIMAVGGYTPVQETTPSIKLGGFRGVPPRSRPV